VLGISVRARPGAKMAARTHTRKLHLFVDEGRRRSFAPRALGFVLQRDGRIPASDSIEAIGSLIILHRDEPTDITVVNRLAEATSIHWHGIELESYSDGVAGWSGTAGHLAPVIAAQDSFTAKLTLPRAGTFIYHTHLDDIEQLTSRLYGAIVVLEPGKKFDAATDHVFVLGWDGLKDPGPLWLVNGDTAGPPIEFAAGVRQRFRFVDIAPAGRVIFSIVRDSSVVSWRPLAKDGAALPAAVAVAGPARRRLNVGETFDAEFIAPAAGEYELTMAPPFSPAKPFYKRRLIAR
jgi:FtsP/CotA-like multicopper oxidase with cupredoxin domain